MNDFIYSGVLSSEIIVKQSMVLREKISGMPMHISKAIFSVFIEMMNNMLMYSCEKINNGAPIGTFILAEENEIFRIESKNLMKTKNVELIKRRIDRLNAMDKQAKREYYIEQIRGKNANPESKGGGVGLTEIAKRTNLPIEYEFNAYNEKLTFFVLRISIS